MFLNMKNFLLLLLAVFPASGQFPFPGAGPRAGGFADAADAVRRGGRPARGVLLEADSGDVEALA